MLEAHKLGQQILVTVNAKLIDRGLMLKTGIVVDATPTTLAAKPSPKNPAFALLGAIVSSVWCCATTSISPITNRAGLCAGKSSGLTMNPLPLPVSGSMDGA